MVDMSHQDDEFFLVSYHFGNPGTEQIPLVGNELLEPGDTCG